MTEDSSTATNADAMAHIRRAVASQLGVERPEAVAIDESALPIFARAVPRELSPEERERLLEAASRLDPWLQGPFPLGGDVVVGGTWRNDTRWEGLGLHVPQDLSGMRVLDVGSNAGYDAFMFRARGANSVVGCEPFEFIEQARFLESVYRTGVDFRRLGWQELDPADLGQFDLIHCHGVLYHDFHPMALLQRLHGMLKGEGTLFFGSMMLADPEMSEYARFVPGAYYGDRTWWWVPGRLAMRWMLEASGFEVAAEFGAHEGPPGEFETLNGYFECRRGTPAPEATHVARAASGV